MLVVSLPTLQKHWHNNFFKGFNRSIHLQAARFCFGGLLQKDLDSVVESSNTHRIRPSGKELYFFPEETGGQNMLQAVIEDDIDEME